MVGSLAVLRLVVGNMPKVPFLLVVWTTKAFFMALAFKLMQPVQGIVRCTSSHTIVDHMPAVVLFQ